MPQVINDSIQQLINDLKVNGIWAVIAQEFYEAAAYTPSYYGGTTAGTTTYSAGYPTGWYIRVGEMVHVWGALVWTGATGTGESRISLPFTHADPGVVRDVPVALRISSTAITNTVAQGLCRAGQNYWRLESVTGSGATAAQSVLGAGNISFHIVYPVS